MNPSPNTPAGMDARTSSSSGRIVELDGLRGMAILFVLLFHYVADQGVWINAGAGAEPGSLLDHFQRLFAAGWAGVDLFFVLSGFLIGGILLDARASPRYFGTFYARRFYRIIPLYYLWIAAFFLLILTPLRGALRGLPGLFSGNPEKWSTVPVYFLFLQNSVQMMHGNFGTAWLGQLWSLAIEEQFYLLMPLAVRFLPLRKLVPLLLLAVIGAPIARVAFMHLVPQHPAAPYVLTLCRADALSIGVLLAAAWRNREWKDRFLRYRTWALILCCLPLTATAFLMFLNPSPYSRAAAAWGFSAIDASCAVLLIVAVLFPSGPWASVCRWPLLVELGRLSYCLYVIHQAVNLICHEAILGATPRFLDWRSAGVTILAALLAYCVARLSWGFFENPSLRRGHAYQYWPRPSVSAVLQPRA